LARALPGSGLGLAIVKQVVIKHGGTLRIDDTVPGGNPPGTAIHVVLPGRPVTVIGDPSDTTRGDGAVDVADENPEN
jgi:two-component system sensor histidine kinase MprB